MAVRDGDYAFVSYAHKDEEAVRPILDALKAAGLNIWYDAGIEVGTEWPEYIASHLIGSACVVALVSPRYVDSQNCRDEVFLARRVGKSMIVAYLEDTELPAGMLLQLNAYQDIRMGKFPSREAFVESLLKAEYLAGCFAEKADGPGGADAIGPDGGSPSAEDGGEKLLRLATLYLEGGEWDLAGEYAKRVLESDPECAEAWLVALMAELRVSKRGSLRDAPEPFEGNVNCKMACRFGGKEMNSALAAANAAIRERVAVRDAEAARRKNLRAVRESEERGDAAPVGQTAELHGAAGHSERAADVRAERTPRTASAAASGPSPVAGEAAGAPARERAEMPKRAGGTAGAGGAPENAASGRAERKAESKPAAKTAAAPQNAASERREPERGTFGQEAANAGAEGGADGAALEASRAKDGKAAPKRGRRRIGIAAGIAAVAAVIAVAAGILMGGSGAASLKDTGLSASSLTVGSTVKLGQYEQDNDTSNGKEDIEWRVLANDGEKVLIVSVYGLDTHVFNEDSSDGNDWDTSDLREWLQGEFASDAGLTAVGSKLTCLSIEEAEEYFESKDDRECVPSAFAIDQDAFTFTGTCWWWLRSPGCSGSTHAAYVGTGGGVCSLGDRVDFSYCAVRPAMWLDL